MGDLFSGERPFHTLSFQEKYKKTLASARWKAMRLRLIEKYDGCQKCKSKTELQLHHLTYERIGQELDTDVEVLCKSCHETADRIRAEAGKRKSRRALHNARLDGWATKKYGENWEDDYDRVSEEFDDWIERQD